MVVRPFLCILLIAAILACLGCSGDDPNVAGQADSGQADGEPAPGNPAWKPSGSDSKSLAQIEQELREHALPAIEITPLKNPPRTPWQSRFGGVPYWPKGTPLPTAPDGEPLFLVAQIDFSETPPLAGFPREGILQFFIASDDLFGLEFAGESSRTQEQINKNPQGHKVVYHPQVEKDTSKLVTVAPSPSPDYFPVEGSYALAFKKIQDPVSLSDCRFDRLIVPREKLPDEDLDKLWENSTGSGSKLGGYAFFTQWDPREEAADQDWLLLLQIDTENDEDISIMWGDAGVGNFFIKPEDLANKDFSQVWYNWDCS